MRFFCVALLLGYLSVSPVFAQLKITGKIIDTKGAALGGATIRLKAGGQMTLSEINGSFAITGSSKDSLLITMTGYQPKTVIVTSSPLQIVLEQQEGRLSEVVLVGTRKSGRIRTETPVPVDLINISQVSGPTARMDLTSILNYAAPSFNYNKQSGSDGADHIDLATLRGLGPDQTLVLVNGKRRHQTAFVAVFGTRGRGNSGTDLGTIPTNAIERVEILRDGASAQYGSDAIAGVINIVLKKSTQGLSGNIGWSGYWDPTYNTAFANDLKTQYESASKIDGNAFATDLNYGLPLGKKGGFINVSMNVLSTGKTFRQALDTSDYYNNPQGMYVNIYRRGHGDASLNQIGSAINLEAPISKKTTFYSFITTSYKSSDAFAFTRNFSAKPERFPTSANGSLIFIDGIMKRTNDGETYYSPHIQTKVNDLSLATGIKVTSGNGWNWDLSNTLGRNDFNFFGDKTFNASKGASQTHFDDGGFNFLQNTLNLNFSKPLSEKTNLAFGVEQRFEKYQIYAGEEASYKNYGNGDKATGAQGFPGYQPSDEVKATRNVWGAYADAEIDLSSAWLVDLALRAEQYSDFGFTANYKLATRYKMSPRLNLRGSISSGFRAPSLQQINFSSTFTTVQAGNIAEVKIAPNYSPLTKAAGIDELMQEKSTNASLGLSWNASKELQITFDAYQVNIKDRIVLSGQFDATDPNLDAALRNQMAALKVSYAQFFANAVNTTNKGIDLVVDYSKKWGKRRLKGLIAGNVQKMSIDKINVPARLAASTFLQQTFLSDREQNFILASAPKTKISSLVEYGFDRFSIGARFTYFGNVTILGFGEDGLGIKPMVPLDNGSGSVPDQYDYKGKGTTDFYGSYRFNSQLTLFTGVDNLFNVHPNLGVAKGAKDWAYNNETGGPWDAVQMGGNGRRFFLKLAFSLK